MVCPSCVHGIFKKIRSHREVDAALAVGTEMIVSSHILKSLQHYLSSKLVKRLNSISVSEERVTCHVIMS